MNRQDGKDLGRMQVTLAAIAVISVVSLAMNITILFRSADGSTGSSPGQFGIEQPINPLGNQLSEDGELRLEEEEAGELLGSQLELTDPSDRGELSEAHNLVLISREHRGRIEGAVYLRVYVDDQGMVTVQTQGGVEGLPRGDYGLWLEPPEDFQAEYGAQPKLLQTDKDRGDGLEIGRYRTEFPMSVTELPFTVTTLEGFTLSFRQHHDGIGPESFDSPAMLSRTIPRAKRFP